jgi:hypothetical protein
MAVIKICLFSTSLHHVLLFCEGGLRRFVLYDTSHKYLFLRYRCSRHFLSTYYIALSHIIRTIVRLFVVLCNRGILCDWMWLMRSNA